MAWRLRAFLVTSVGVVPVVGVSEGAELLSVGAVPGTVGMVAWVVSVGRVVSWVAVGVGMTVGRVVSSVIMPPGWVLTLAAQPQPVKRAAADIVSLFFVCVFRC